MRLQKRRGEKIFRLVLLLEIRRLMSLGHFMEYLSLSKIMQVINHLFKVKLQIEEKGRISTVGCAHMVDYIGREDAISVRMIREAGGIPFVKSNNCQIVFSMNTDNFIYGIAQNPYNVFRTTGGSSGGEGGLAATKCSPLGLGTDIGGSIRYPAAFNGVYAFKPTPYRVS